MFIKAILETSKYCFAFIRALQTSPVSSELNIKVRSREAYYSFSAGCRYTLRKNRILIPRMNNPGPREPRKFLREVAHRFVISKVCKVHARAYVYHT